MPSVLFSVFNLQRPKYFVANYNTMTFFFFPILVPPSRRGAEAVQDRDSRLSDLQLKMEELSREKVRAVEDNGSEVARLEMRMATAIKDNGELLRRTR